MHVDQHQLAREGAQAEARLLREQLDAHFPDHPERAVRELEAQAAQVERDLETHRLAAYRAEMLISALHHQARHVGMASLRAKLSSTIPRPSAPEE